MSTRETNAIERHQTPNRQGWARVKRKSIGVSKSLALIDGTMALCAKFHGNGDDHWLLNALQT